MNVRVLIGACIVVAFTGCPNIPTPSAADARAKLANQIRHRSGGLIKLISFEATGEEMHEVSGIKNYEISYNAEIAFMDDCLWGGSDPLIGWDFRARPRNAPPPAPDGSVTIADFQDMKPAAKGERLKISGKVEFERTDRRWQ
jgi:hypothetical protein